jgi:hypothetical protein
LLTAYLTLIPVVAGSNNIHTYAAGAIIFEVGYASLQWVAEFETRRRRAPKLTSLLFSRIMLQIVRFSI